MAVPLLAGVITRKYLVGKRGSDYFEKEFVNKFDGITTLGLLLTLILIFSSQANAIVENPLHIVLIGIPLILQTILIFSIAYMACKFLDFPLK